MLRLIETTIIFLFIFFKVELYFDGYVLICYVVVVVLFCFVFLRVFVLVLLYFLFPRNSLIFEFEA